MLDAIVEMFSYEFLIRAFVVGCFVAVAASLLGVMLVLKKYSMIGDGLSHVGFGALALATVLNMSPLLFSIPIVMLIAFLLLRIGESGKIKGDSLIAIISAGSMSFGIMVISLTIGINIDIYNYLFGSILAISQMDAIISVIACITILILFLLFYNKLFAVTFDEQFAKATGMKTSFYNFLLSILTSVIIVIGMKLMGSLLISSLIIFPSITSMLIFKKFKQVCISASIISLICFIIGIFVSYWCATPTGASIVMANLILLIIVSIIRNIYLKNI